MRHQLWLCSRYFRPGREQGIDWAVYVKTDRAPRYSEHIKADIAVTIAGWAFAEDPAVESVVVGIFQPVGRRANHSTFLLCPFICNKGVAGDHPEYRVKRTTVKGDSISADVSGGLDSYQVFRPKKAVRSSVAKKRVKIRVAARERALELADTVIDALQKTRNQRRIRIAATDLLPSDEATG